MKGMVIAHEGRKFKTKGAPKSQKERCAKQIKPMCWGRPGTLGDITVHGCAPEEHPVGAETERNIRSERRLRGTFGRSGD